MKKLLNQGGFNNMVRGRYGYVVYNQNDTYVGKAIELYGEYQEAEICVFRQVCKPGDYVMDIGANIGTHTLALSRIVGNEGFVFAFEPQAVIFQTLCANMAVNSIENVECFKCAVSDKDGTIRLPRLDNNQPNNFGGLEVEIFDVGDSVATISLDQYFNTLKRLDFIKIDVEGMEKKVLQGARKFIDIFQPTLYVENDKIDKSVDLIRYIKSMGYIPYWHTPYLYNADNHFKNPNNVYGEIVSVNMLCVPEMYRMKNLSHLEVVDENFHPLK
jgi:FkbM family methyltransferase